MEHKAFEEAIAPYTFKRFNEKTNQFEYVYTAIVKRMSIDIRKPPVYAIKYQEKLKNEINNEEVYRGPPKTPIITPQGTFKSVTLAALHYNISIATVYSRIANKKSIKAEGWRYDD